MPAVRERGTAVDARAQGAIAQGQVDVGRGAAALGAGIASATQDVGGVIGAIAQKAHMEAEGAAINEAYAGLASAKQYWLDDPRDGLASRKGKAALAERNRFMDRFRQTAKEIRASLPSDRARAQFDGILAKEVVSFESSADNYVARETEELAQQALDGALSAARSDAAAAIKRKEYDKAEDAIGNGLGALDKRAKAQGWDESFAEKQRRDFETAARLGVVEAMLESGDHAAAAEYMETARVYMDEATIAKSGVDARIKAAAVDGNAKALADQIFEGAGGDVQGALQFAEPEDIPDPALRYAVRENILRRGREREEANRLHDAPLIDRLELGLREGKGAQFNSQEYESLTEGGKAQYRRMVTAEARAYRSARAETRRYQNEIDANADADYRGREVGQRVGLDLVATYPDATQRQRDLIRERQNKDKETLSKATPTDVRAFKTEVHRLATAAQLAGVKGSTVQKGSQADNFNAYMNEQFMAFIEQNERPPTIHEARQMAADALLYGEETNSGKAYDPDTRAFEARRKGKEFDPKDFEAENAELLKGLGLDAPEGTEPAAPAPLQPSGTVTLIGPTGQKPRRATMTPELQAWLQTPAGKQWRIQ